MAMLSIKLNNKKIGFIQRGEKAISNSCHTEWSEKRPVSRTKARMWPGSDWRNLDHGGRDGRIRASDKAEALCALWGGQNEIAEVLMVHWRLGYLRGKKRKRLVKNNLKRGIDGNRMGNVRDPRHSAKLNWEA
jgi:hypothetical protein